MFFKKPSPIKLNRAEPHRGARYFQAVLIHPPPTPPPTLSLSLSFSFFSSSPLDLPGRGGVGPTRGAAAPSAISGQEGRLQPSGALPSARFGGRGGVSSVSRPPGLIEKEGVLRHIRLEGEVSARRRPLLCQIRQEGRRRQRLPSARSDREGRHPPQYPARRGGVSPAAPSPLPDSVGGEAEAASPVRQI